MLNSVFLVEWDVADRHQGNPKPPLDVEIWADGLRSGMSREQVAAHIRVAVRDAFEQRMYGSAKNLEAAVDWAMRQIAERGD